MVNQPEKPSEPSRQNQYKRQREWVYLCHYLAITGLDPIHIISGKDDGHEPDFTLVFEAPFPAEGTIDDTPSQDSPINKKATKPATKKVTDTPAQIGSSSLEPDVQPSAIQLYYVGVELTTLPRLRDQMGEKALIPKLWYWRSLHEMARLRGQVSFKPYRYERFYLPMATLYMPEKQFNARPTLPSPVTQADIDAVLAKKAHKASAYRERRQLHALLLLIHTDKYQPESILVAEDALTHNSGFDQIVVTRYPSHKLMHVRKSE